MNNRTLLTQFVCAGLLIMVDVCGASAAFMEEVVDQSNEDATAGLLESRFESIGQSFTPTLGLIDFVELGAADFSTASRDHTVRVDIRDGTIDGPNLGSSSTLELPDCFNRPEGPGCGIAGGGYVTIRLDFPEAIPLTPGNTYVLVVDATGDVGVRLNNGGNPYPGGTAYIEGVADPNIDLWFREGATVPEPLTTSILITSLVAAVIRRPGAQSRHGFSRLSTPASPSILS